MNAPGQRLMLRMAIAILLLIALLGMGINMLATAQTAPEAWTGKADYRPNELVDIHGRGFLPGSPYRLLVVWPDGSARVDGNNGVVVCLDPTVSDGSACYQEFLADDDGTFLVRYQLLNGLQGQYVASVYDQAGVLVAQVTFTDDSSGPGSSHSHLVRNANELPGQNKAVDSTAFESQRKAFRNPRGLRSLYALVVESNDESPASGGLAGGLWLFRSTDGGSSWNAVQRLVQDNGNPPSVSGSLWTYDDGTQLVVYVVYAKDPGGQSAIPISYRRILISDTGVLAVGAEQPTGRSTDSTGGKPASARPVIVRDRNGNVHIGFWKSKTTLSVFGTLVSNPGDAPTWSATTDVLVYPNNGTQNLSLLLPFSSGALLGYVGVGMVGTGGTSENRLYARNIAAFNPGTGAYTLATQRDIGGIIRNPASSEYLPLSGLVSSGNVADILYVKQCPGSGGGQCASNAAGSATGVYSRKATAAGSVDAWDNGIQVSPTVAATASLTIDTAPNPERLYAIFGTNLGIVSFKSSAADSIVWGATGCAETGGTTTGTQCDIVTAETNVDWLSSSYSSPIQVLWTVQTVASPVKHYYLNTPPNITLTFTPDGSNGWFKTNPTPAANGSVTATDDDAIANIACTVPVTLGSVVGSDTPSASGTVSVNGETSGVTISCTATDEGGASATASAVIKIDATPPSITRSRAPGPNASGWNNGDVTVSFGCSDALSGLAAGSPPPDTVLSGEGAGQSVTGSCSDRAGNSASGPESGINIDKTLPTASAVASPGPNGSGWNNTDVVVSFSGTDGLSGIAGCSSAVTLSAEGTGQSASGTCTDQAGNVSATATANDINIDKAKPVISGSRSPEANGHGWNNADVVVSFGCSEAGLVRSGIATDSVAGATVSTEGMDQSVANTGVCRDQADNDADPATVSGISIDKTQPVIMGSRTPAANGFGWNNVNVAVSFTCADAGPVQSGLDVNTVAGTTLNTEGSNQSVTNSGNCTDKAGNAANGATVGSISIDQTDPVVASSLDPLPNANHWNNSDVTVHFSCQDTLSGVDSLSPDALVITEGAEQNIGGMCTDKAGNDALTIATVNLDRTPPVATVSRSPAANAFGWNNTTVTAHWAATDTLSGIFGSAIYDLDFSAEGAGQTGSHDFTDLAGNSASATISDINVDKTAPSIVGSRMPAANERGWNNSDVTVNYICSDALSGIETCSDPEVLASEGTGQSRSGAAVDEAGNSASATVSEINIDKTSPVVTVSRTPAANGFGWNNTTVTAHWEATDNLSGFADPAIYNFNFTNEGAGQTGSYGFTDLAGNSASATIDDINIDETKPSIAGSRSPAANSHEWNNTDVVVSFACTEDGLVRSGIATDSVAGATVGTEGMGQSVTNTGVCRDQADNDADPATVSGISIDKTQPVIMGSRTPAANGFGWNNVNVAVSFTCADAGPVQSGLDVNTVAGTTLNTEGSNQSVTNSGNCTDKAGNAANAAMVGGINIDNTAPYPPTASADRTPEYDPTPASNPGDDWYRNSVTVTFAANGDPDLADGGPGSGIDLSSVPGPSTISAAGAFAESGTVKDKAGNTSAAGTLDGNVDTQSPVVVISCPLLPLLGGSASASWTASDPSPGSGLATTASGTVSLDTNSVGGKIAAAPLARDNVGHESSPAATCGYAVIYRFDGFLQPINDTAHQVGVATSIFKAGSTVPAKLALKRADGTIVQAASLPLWLTPAKGSSMSDSVDESLYSDPATTGPTYRWDGSQYIYNWGTAKNQAGFYWRVGVKLDDGQIYWVNIGLR